ncbi:hypothetical protein AB2M62_04050 [Sphingomonas sp. MMS12-HWE2-04]|uniref:hypothetical protein n=1 Tax=Sphingomonas sp. MMS12-HWE2-04 TaxID=3234199 RepID=UPI00384B876B
MRKGGLTRGRLIVGLLPALGGHAHAQEPSHAEVIQAATKILDQEPLCALPPRALDNRWGEHRFLAAEDRAAIEPFLQAGLLQRIDKPAGAPDATGRLWYAFTPYGEQWSALCLVNRDTYPVQFHWGFRIGTPEIVKTYPLTVFTRSACEASAGVMFEFRMRLEPWFVPGRFATNFGPDDAMLYFDAAQNVGRAHVRYASGDGEHWREENTLYGHRLPVMCEKLENPRAGVD